MTPTGDVDVGEPAPELRDEARRTDGQPHPYPNPGENSARAEADLGVRGPLPEPQRNRHEAAIEILHLAEEVQLTVVTRSGQSQESAAAALR